MRSLHEQITKQGKISGSVPERWVAFLRVATDTRAAVYGLNHQLNRSQHQLARPLNSQTGQTVYAMTTCTKRDRVYTPAKVRTALAMILLHTYDDDEPPSIPAVSNSATSSSVITVKKRVVSTWEFGCNAPTWCTHKGHRQQDNQASAHAWSSW